MRVIRLAGLVLFVAGIAKELAETGSVEFENGVKEIGKVNANGAATEKEPNRSANGKAERRNRVYVITFDDDRVERWTPVGGRMVVEHWFPASPFPDGRRVLGIADRTQ